MPSIEEQRVGRLARELQQALQEISNKKSKTRKEGVSHLETILENEWNLIVIDSLTFGVGPDRKSDAYACKYASWTAILQCLIEQVESTVEKSLSRGQNVDSTLSRVVRNVVNKATSKRRTYHANVLEPCSVTLVNHLASIMQRMSPFRSQIQLYNDYAMALKFVLENGEYTLCLGENDLERAMIPLAGIILKNIEASESDNTISSFIVKDLSLLRLLLSRFRYDMEANLAVILQEILVKFGEEEHARVWTARISNEVVGLCVDYMIHCRGDDRVHLCQIVKKYHHFCMLLLRDGNPEGREASLNFFRLALRLELLEDSDVINLIDWYQGLDLDLSWQRSPETNEHSFNQIQSSLIHLLAEIEVWIYEKNIPVRGTGQYSTQSAKRMRRNRQGNVLDDTLANVSLLGPVTCMFIRNHGALLAEEDFEIFCSHIGKQIQDSLQHSFVAEQVKPDVIWCMRLLYSLITAACKRRVLNEMCRCSLANAISRLVQQYGVLSSYPLSRDEIKMIIIAALPILHDAIRFSSNGVSLKKDLLSETPSCLSIILLMSLLRYNKVSSTAQESKIYIEWILSSLNVGLPVDLVCSALGLILLLHGSVKNDDIPQFVNAFVQKNIWWQSTAFDEVIESLPPVSSWSLYNTHPKILDACQVSHSSHSAKTRDELNVYVCQSILNLMRLNLGGKEDDVIRVGSLGLAVLASVCDGTGRQQDCWSPISEYYNHVKACVSLSVHKIKDMVEMRSRLSDESVKTLLTLAKAMSQLKSSCSSEYHKHLNELLDQLPSMDRAMTIHMSIGNNANEECEPIHELAPAQNQSHSQGMLITVTKGVNSSQVAVPMIEWYLQFYQHICSYNEAVILKQIESFSAYFRDNDFFLPMAIRRNVVLCQTRCIEAMLGSNPLLAAENIQNVPFLDKFKGVFSLEQNYLFRPDIFEFCLKNGQDLVSKSLEIQDKDFSSLCAGAIASQIIQIIEESTEETTSEAQRIFCARILIEILEVDASLVPDTSFDFLVDWLASQVLDRYGVRIHASLVFPKLLDLFKDPSILFQRVMEMLPLQGNDNEAKIPLELDKVEIIGTIVFTLARVAAVVPCLEISCVCNLLQELSVDDQRSNDSILKAFTWLADSLEYKDAAEYIETMAAPIITELIQDQKRSVNCLEKYFMVCSLVNLDEVPCKELILAFLMYHRSANGVKGFLQYLNNPDFFQILNSSMSEICAVHLYMSSAEEIQTAQQEMESNISKMVDTLIQKPDLRKIDDRLTENLLVSVIGNSRRNQDAQDMTSELFPPDVILAAEYAEFMISKEGSQLRPLDYIELFIKIQRNIFKLKHPRHKIFALKSLKCSILFTLEQLGSPGVLRQILGILSNLMRFPTTCETSCQLLMVILPKALENNLEAAVQNSVISTIGKAIPTILSYICDTIQLSKPEPESPVLECIKFLTCSAPDLLKSFAFILDPRVESLLGADGQVDNGDNGSRRSLSVYLDMFADTVKLMSAATRSHHIKEMQQMIGELEDAELIDSSKFIKEDSLWKITLAADSTNDESLIDFAGQLLCYFGPLNPNVLSFKPKSQSNLQCAKYNKYTNKDSAVENLEKDVLHQLLVLLSNYLVDEDAYVASEAFTILQEILSTSNGLSSYNMLDPLSREHLAIFLHGRPDVVDTDAGTRKPDQLNPELWALESVGYDQWITSICENILMMTNDRILESCGKLASCRPAFAEVILPLAFAKISMESNTQINIDMSQTLGWLLNGHVLPYCGKFPRAANVLWKTLHCLRQLYCIAEDICPTSDFKIPPMSWEKIYWVDIEYLKAAEACIESRSLYSALIFAEMWHEKEDKSASSGEFRKYESVMQEIYSLLPEPDGLYGMSRANDALSQLRRFEREGDWSKALAISDVALQLSQENSGSSVMNIPQKEALNAIKRCLGNLGATYLLSAASLRESEHGQDAKYTITDGAVSLGEWHPISTSNDSSLSDSADKYLSLAMKHFQAGNLFGFTEAVQHVRKEVVGLLASASRETTADLNPLLVKTQMTQCLVEAWSMKWQESKHSSFISQSEQVVRPEIERLAKLWKCREEFAGAGWRFALEMPLKDLRYQILKDLNQEEMKVECLLDIAVCARKSDRNGQALGALSRFRQSVMFVKESWTEKYRAPHANWRVEEAKNLWAQNQLEAGVNALLSYSMQASVYNESNVIEMAYLNSVLAKWLAKMQRESSSEILRIFQDNTEHLLQFQNLFPSPSTKICRIYYRLATYVSQLSKEIARKKLSSEWIRSNSILEKKIRERESLNAELEAKKGKRGRNDRQTNSVQQIMSSISRINAAIQEDSKIINTAHESETEYEMIAIRGYSLCLKHGDHYNLPAMFGLVGIWLSHSSDSMKEHINARLKEDISDVPSHKMIPLSYQLASRISQPEQDGSRCSFQENLNALLFRMTRDHPFHMLPILYALKNGDKTVDINLGNGSAGGLVFEANANRMAAAVGILRQVTALSKRLATIVAEMDVATKGYIDIALTPVSKQERDMPFPAKWRRKFSRELRHVPVLSVLLPLDLSLEYKNIPTISSIDEKITFPGGINKPKLVTITDSHGDVRRQLVKGGRDDLRQDTVMQQFFRICNAFLEDSKPAASRNLSILTFNALPFSPSSGLLEWIDNTDTLARFIADGNSQFTRAANLAFTKLMEVQTSGRDAGSMKSKRTLFEECIRIVGPPRMRKVFLRRFPDPGSWFEARLAYTRSVAVNSMAGHIVGLGDRHLSNILMSKSTAEVVHIDLGIAFDQGKLLATPEQVPFRLTRNMVDGMGATGVEGVMRRCCEETLRVLRKHKDPLLTVLSVFIHDPLYKWALTYERATKKQDNDQTQIVFSAGTSDVEGNVDANRTLLAIQHKLEGIIGGDTTARGVEGQVQYLIHEAMDPDNLCRMYRGWQACI